MPVPDDRLISKHRAFRSSYYTEYAVYVLLNQISELHYERIACHALESNFQIGMALVQQPPVNLSSFTFIYCKRFAIDESKAQLTVKIF